MIVFCIIGALTLVILLWGIQLIRGRLLNTIAGNNLVSKAEYSEPAQIGLGKRVGRTLICASALTLFLALAILFNELDFQELNELFLSLTYITIIPLLILVALSFNWSLRHMK